MSTPSIDEAAFEAYSEEVDVYERTWHTEPVEPQRSFLATRPHLKAALFLRAVEGKRTFTRDVYAENDIWTRERRDLQSQLLAKRLENDHPTPPAPEAVYFLIGLPGSGKSTALRPLALAHAGLAAGMVMVSDADELRASFPEYVGGRGSGVVQDECSDLMYDRQIGAGPEAGLQGAILNSGHTTIVDVIGSPDYLPPLVRRLRRMGRRVYVLQTSCETSTCIARAKERALATGRLVPPDLILAKDGVPEKTLEATKMTTKLSGWAVVDTNGSEPQILDSESFNVAAAA